MVWLPLCPADTGSSSDLGLPWGSEAVGLSTIELDTHESELLPLPGELSA